MAALTGATLISVAILVALLIVVCWLTNLVGLPGNWLMLLTGIGYWFAVRGSESVLTITWVTLAAMGVMALLGELTEFLASSTATSGAGGARRSVVLALLGSIVGGLVGLFVPIPIPIIGSLIGALLFGGLGAAAGAAVGEKWAGRNTDDSIQVGKAAFWGRLYGTLTKTAIGLLIVIWFLAALAL